MLMSCNALNQSTAKIYNYIGKKATKKYKILVIRDLKRLFSIQDYPRAGRCFSLQDQRLLFPFLFLSIHIAVAITIAVPVPVTITIAVAVMVVVGAVEDQRHVREFPLLVHGLDVRKLATVKAAGPHHEDRDVGDAVGDRRVRHKTDRTESVMMLS